VLVHLVVVGLVSATWLSTEDPVLTLYVGGFIVTPTYLGLMVLETRRAALLVSPLSFHFLWYSIGLGLAAVSIASRVAAHETIRLGAFALRPADLAFGYVLILIGSVAFHLGVQLTRPLTPRRGDGSTVTSNDSRRYPELLVLIWALGIAARLVHSDTTMAGAVFGILTWAANAALCAYCLSTSPSQPRISWALVIIGCLVELAINLQSFSKAYIMYSFVPLLWTCAYFRSYRIWLVPIGAAVALFYLLIVAPVVSRARDEGRLDQGDTYAARLLRNYAEYTVADSDISAQAEKFFERQFDPIPAGFIHGEVQKYGLRYGDTMDYLAYAFIPRLVWPDKPAVSRGAWFTVYLRGASNEEDASTATALTAAGELYWNFGLWAVIVGMIVLGTLIGILWRIAGAAPNTNPLKMLLYFNTLILVVDNAQAGVTAVACIQRILLLGSVIWLWDRNIGGREWVGRRSLRDGIAELRSLRRALQLNGKSTAERRGETSPRE
jgi:hypothetical protein